MVTKNWLTIFLLLLMFLFVAGCYSVEINQKIQRDGSASVKVTYDFTNMLEMARQMQPGEDPEGDISKMCEDFGQSNTLLEKMNCVYENGVLVITGELPRGSIRLHETGDTHKYYVKDVYEFMTSMERQSEDEDAQFSDDTLRELGGGSEMLNVKMEYVIEVDGEILNADVGEIQGNMLVVNMFDLPETSNPSMEINFERTVGGGKGISIISVILIVLLVIVGGIIVYLYLEKKKSGTNKNLSPKIQELINWIREYESKYPEDMLRKVLEERGHTKQDIEQAFKNK